MYTTQTCGVTVAQVILVHFVEVRILTGLPFFCPYSRVIPAKSTLCGFCSMRSQRPTTLDKGRYGRKRTFTDMYRH